MFCNECGTKIEGGDMFCYSCGAKVIVPRQRRTQNSNYRGGEDNKKNKLMLLMGALFCATVIGAIWAVSQTNSNDDDHDDYLQAIECEEEREIRRQELEGADENISSDESETNQIDDVDGSEFVTASGEQIWHSEQTEGSGEFSIVASSQRIIEGEPFDLVFTMTNASSNDVEVRRHNTQNFAGIYHRCNHYAVYNEPIHIPAGETVQYTLPNVVAIFGEVALYMRTGIESGDGGSTSIDSVFRTEVAKGNNHNESNGLVFNSSTINGLTATVSAPSSITVGTLFPLTIEVVNNSTEYFMRSLIFPTGYTLPLSGADLEDFSSQHTGTFILAPGETYTRTNFYLARETGLFRGFGSMGFYVAEEQPVVVDYFYEEVEEGEEGRDARQNIYNIEFVEDRTRLTFFMTGLELNIVQ